MRNKKNDQPADGGGILLKRTDAIRLANRIRASEMLVRSNLLRQLVLLNRCKGGCRRGQVWFAVFSFSRLADDDQS